jgi:hypothetical protein
MTNLTKEIYIVGIPEKGGSWIGSSECFDDIESAQLSLKKDRDSNIHYTKIFTLRIVNKVPISGDYK